jgi:hypothetical protein
MMSACNRVRAGPRSFEMKRALTRAHEALAFAVTVA